MTIAGKQYEPRNETYIQKLQRFSTKKNKIMDSAEE